MVTRRPNIWKLQADKDISGLSEALEHPDPDIRKRAAAALRIIGSTKAIFALERAFDREENPYVREHISSALSYLNHDTLVQELITNKNVVGLIEMLNSPREDEILNAIQALGNIGDRTATEGLVMVFRNPLTADDIRLAAAESLLKLENAPAVVTLLGALRKDDWQVRRNAVTVLGQLKATWATKPLIKALNDEHAKVRRSAELALKQINTPISRDALRNYLKAEETTKTGPLQDIINQQLKMGEVNPITAIPQQQEVVGSADDDKPTLASASQQLKDTIQKEVINMKKDDFSPALAAAEAALAELSPDGESLFDDEIIPTSRPRSISTEDIEDVLSDDKPE